MKTAFFILGLSFNIVLCIYPFQDKLAQASLSESPVARINQEVKEEDSFEPLTYSELLRSKAALHLKNR